MESHRPLAQREHGRPSGMDFWHGGDMVDRVTQAPGMEWSMVKDALVQNKTSLCRCYQQGVLGPTLLICACRFGPCCSSSSLSLSQRH